VASPASGKRNPPGSPPPDGLSLLCALNRVEARQPESRRGDHRQPRSFLCIGIATYGICLRPLQGLRSRPGRKSACGGEGFGAGRWVEASTLAAAFPWALPGLSLPYGKESFQGLSDQLGAGLAAEAWPSWLSFCIQVSGVLGYGTHEAHSASFSCNHKL